MSNDQNQELPLLTFNALYNILREEKKSKNLQKFPELFYEALDQFLKSKKESIKKLKEKGENDLLKKEKNILKNSQKIAIEIIEQRAQKISKIAIHNATSNQDVLESEKILEPEQELLGSISKNIKKLTKNLN